VSVRTNRPPELSTSPVPLGLARRDFSIAAACLTGAGPVKPEFSTRPGTRCHSPVTNHGRPSSQRIGFAKSSGSGRTSRHKNRLGYRRAADGDLSTRRRAPGPHDTTLTGDAVGVRTMLSSAQASGWRESVEGSRRIRVSSRPIPAKLPIPAAGFRRRALFSRTAPRQLRATRGPLAASDAVRSRRHASIIPLHPGGGTSSCSDRAYGIS